MREAGKQNQHELSCPSLQKLKLTKHRFLCFGYSLICTPVYMSIYMKRFVFFSLLVILLSPAAAQKFSGQWTGSFVQKNDTTRTEYVLEIEAKGKTFEGTSITYFTIKKKRYYTICEIKGTIDPGSKTLISTEVKKIKANTPIDFNDCLQTHTLTYFKKGNTEQLIGTWQPAKPEDACGVGTTLLERKALVKNMRTQAPANNNQTARSNPAAPGQSTTPAANNATVKPAPANNKTTGTNKAGSGSVSRTTQQNSAPPPAKPAPDLQPAISKVENKATLRAVTDSKPNVQAPKLPNGLERRDNRLFETITITEEAITISLYDNAEVDGDIITVLFNDEVVVSQQTLSDKPITVLLKAIPGRDNTLVMYAENQGRVPPNTAIMRVQSGENYYKVFLSADDKRNASVIFRLRK